MIPGDAGETECAFAVRALAIEMGLSVSDPQIGAAQGHEQTFHRAAKGGVFSLPFRDVAG